MTIMVIAHKSKLRKLMNIVLELYPDDIVVPIDDGMSAVQFALHNPVECVYTCLQASPISGLMVGKLLRVKKPDISMHLIADTEQYLPDAVDDNFDGYYTMPVSVESLRRGNLMDSICCKE